MPFVYSGDEWEAAGLRDWATSGHCRHHTVVGVEDEASGAVLAVVALLVLADDQEGVEDVLCLGVGEAVDVQEGGVEVGAERGAAVGVLAERGPSSPISRA